MKRSGYKEGYDKNNISGSQMKAERIAEVGLSSTYVEKKKKLKTNLIELAIGLVLLGFCRSYLQSHPAEKISLFSGFEIILQKAKVLISPKGANLQEKFELERNFAEVISLAEDGDCLDDKNLQQLKIRLEKLKQRDAETFQEQQAVLKKYISLSYAKVKKSCDNDKE